MKPETDYLLENGLAVPSHSRWSSPCLVDNNPDVTPTFIKDYRKVNSLTVSDFYPLPRSDDCTDRVGMSNLVTNADQLKGYWPFPLSSAASEMSAFVTTDALLQYTVMPFCMRNAPASFQRLREKNLSQTSRIKSLAGFGWTSTQYAVGEHFTQHDHTIVNHIHRFSSRFFFRLKKSSRSAKIAECCKFVKGRLWSIS